MAEPGGASGERTLEQVKAEIIRRAGRSSPLEHINPEDAQAAVAALTSLDRDHWAAVWCATGLRHEARGDALLARGAGPAAMDHLAQRADIDGSRIGVWGGSFGGYWAAKLAHVEAARLKAAVTQGGNVHILLEHGVPKTARVYPDGGHMGRTPGMKESAIADLIAQWLAERLAAD